MMRNILLSFLLTAAAFGSMARDIAETTENQLKEVISDYVFDRIDYAEQVLKNPVGPIDSFEHIKKTHRGNCIGMAKMLLADLEQDYDAKIVLSSLPSSYTQHDLPLLIHAAVVIKAEDGYVLLDPGMPIPKAVILQNNREAVVKCENIEWHFLLNGDRIEAKRVEEEFFYDLSTFYTKNSSLDPMTTEPITFLKKSFSSYRNDSEGRIVGGLSISVNKKLVLMQMQGKFLPPITFEEFLNNGFNSMDDTFFLLMKQERKELEEKIKFIIKNHHLLKGWACG